MGDKKDGIVAFLVESMDLQEPVLIRISAITPHHTDSVFNVEGYCTRIVHDLTGHPDEITFKCRRGIHVEAHAKLPKGKPAPNSNTGSSRSARTIAESFREDFRDGKRVRRSRRR